ncbi:MAG: hypothetical protein M1824_002512 [Vezdaea acicularis]|nr:MAG: hypothetical protein M1824_002512 [Vezdaea acicularis]
MSTSTKRKLEPAPNLPEPISPRPETTTTTTGLSTGFTAQNDTPQKQQAQSPPAPPPSKKRRASGPPGPPATATATTTATATATTPTTAAPPSDQSLSPPVAKKSRTNTPWTPAEEHRLKQMRDASKSWSEIAKTFPTRTEGSVKKHWYKDMHYAEFAEDESAALLAAIKEYESSKWKVIGQKVGKPAKACEQYAKEHFGGKL